MGSRKKTGHGQHFRFFFFFPKLFLTTFVQIVCLCKCFKLKGVWQRFRKWKHFSKKRKCSSGAISLYFYIIFTLLEYKSHHLWYILFVICKSINVFNLVLSKILSHWTLLLLKQALVFMRLQFKSFENTVGLQDLTLSHTRNFRLFGTERVSRRQFRIWWKWQKVLQKGRKYYGKRGNWSSRAISPFSTQKTSTADT